MEILKEILRYLVCHYFFLMLEYSLDSIMDLSQYQQSLSILTCGTLEIRALNLAFR